MSPHLVSKGRWPGLRLLPFLFCASAWWQRGGALRCWGCIGSSCDQHPANNYRARPMTCASPQEAVCLKVDYSVKIGGDVIKMVTRSCATREACARADAESLDKCRQGSSTFLDGRKGCSQRSCCRDTDLCNLARPCPRSHALLYLSLPALALVAMGT